MWNGTSFLSTFQFAWGDEVPNKVVMKLWKGINLSKTISKQRVLNPDDEVPLDKEGKKLKVVYFQADEWKLLPNSQRVKFGWEMAVILRKSLLLGIATGFLGIENLISQIMFTIIILLSFMIVHLRLNPYKYTKINSLDTLAYVSEISGCTYVVWHLSAYQPADVTTVSEAQSVQKLLSTDFQILSIIALFLVFVYFFVLLFFILQGTDFYRSLTKKGRMKAARTSKSTIQAKRPSVHKFQLKNLKAFVDEVHQFPTHDLVKIHDTDDIEHDHSVDYRFLDNYKKVVAAGDIVHTVHDKREAKVVRVYMRSTDETPFADLVYIIEVARKIEVVSKKPHLEDGDFSMANPLVLKNTMLAAKLEHDNIVEQMKMEL